MSTFIHARVYPGKDEDLINWLDSLPPGERSRMIREALRAGIGLVSPPRSDSALLAEIVRQAVAAAQQGIAYDRNEVEEAFGDQLDHLLGNFG